MKTLKKNLKSTLDTIDELLKIPRTEFSKSDFHKLRVEIKKLNAIFYLINFCSKDFKRKKTFQPFKEIFKQAGKVRELQIEETILEEYLSTESLLDYRKNIKTKQLEEQDSFFQFLGKKLEKSITDKIEILIPFVDQVGKKKANDFIEKKRRIIQNLVNKTLLKTDELHELRKLLKILKYTVSSISVENGESIDSEELVLIDLLGDWHDFHVILKQLDKALESKEIQSSEIEEIKEVKLKISKERDLLLSQIEKLMSKSIFFKK